MCTGVRVIKYPELIGIYWYLKETECDVLFNATYVVVSIIDIKYTTSQFGHIV